MFSLFTCLIAAVIFTAAVLGTIQYRCGRIETDPEHTDLWIVLGFNLLGLLVFGVISALIDSKRIPMDTETWSGYVTEAKYQPEWVEYYEYAVYRTEHYTETETYTDSKGNSHTRTVHKTREVFDHWEPTSETHGPQWSASIYFGAETSTISIEDWRYADIKTRWNGTDTPTPGSRSVWHHHNSRLLRGDPNDYIISKGATPPSPFYPYTALRQFENRLLAVPTAYTFQEVPPGTPVFEWPRNDDHWSSTRVLGTATEVFPVRLWDEMNSELGPSHKANVIVVGFGSDDAALGPLQEAAWHGGKKNDVVICYGGSNPKKPTWSYVFGWTTSGMVKEELRSLFSGTLSVNMIPDIKAAVTKYYSLRHYEADFAYVDVPRSPTQLVGTFGTLMVLEAIAFFFAVQHLCGSCRHEIFGYQGWKKV